MAWTCSKCTFINEKDAALACEMCNNIRESGNDDSRLPEDTQIVSWELNKNATSIGPKLEDQPELPEFASTESNDQPQFGEAKTANYEPGSMEEHLARVSHTLRSQLGLKWIDSALALKLAVENYSTSEIAESFAREHAEDIIMKFISLDVNMARANNWDQLKKEWRMDHVKGVPGFSFVENHNAFLTAVIYSMRLCAMTMNAGSLQYLPTLTKVLSPFNALFQEASTPQSRVTTPNICSVEDTSRLYDDQGEVIPDPSWPNISSTQLYLSALHEFHCQGGFMCLFRKISSSEDLSEIERFIRPIVANRGKLAEGVHRVKPDIGDSSVVSMTPFGERKSQNGSMDFDSHGEKHSTDHNKMLNPGPVVESQTGGEGVVVERDSTSAVSRIQVENDVLASRHVKGTEFPRMDPSASEAVPNEQSDDVFGLLTATKLIPEAKEAQIRCLELNEWTLEDFLHLTTQAILNIPFEKLVVHSKLISQVVASLKLCADSVQKQLTYKRLISASWIRLSLTAFHSSKIRERRFGVEQLGVLVKDLLFSQRIDRQKVTDWLEQEGVFEGIFGDRIDDRVISCAEGLLQHVQHSQAMFDRMLSRADSKAVRKLLETLSLYYSLSEDLVVYLFDRAATQVETHQDDGCFQFIRDTVQANRVSLIHKGDKAAFAVLNALWMCLQQAVHTTGKLDKSLLDTFAETLGREKARQYREHFASRCMRCIRSRTLEAPPGVEGSAHPATEQQSLPCDERPGATVPSAGGHASFPHDQWSGTGGQRVQGQESPPGDERAGTAGPPGMRTDALIACKVLKRILETFPTEKPGYSVTSYGATSSQLTQTEFVERLEREWELRDVLFTSALACPDSTPGVLKAHLRLLSAACNTASPSVRLTQPVLDRLWGRCSANPALESTFMSWLRQCAEAASAQGQRLMALPLAEHALEALFGDEAALASLGTSGYYCLQTLFVDVNRRRGCLDAVATEWVAPEHEFLREPPPPALAGSRLQGRRVALLGPGGAVERGKVQGFSAVTNKHSVLLEQTAFPRQVALHQEHWRLLPPTREAQAGPVRLQALRCPVSDLAGLASVWKVATCAGSDRVALRALELLLGLYAHALSRELPACPSPGSFVARVLAELGAAQQEAAAVRALMLLQRHVLGTAFHGRLPFVSHKARATGHCVRVLARCTRLEAPGSGATTQRTKCTLEVHVRQTMESFLLQVSGWTDIPPERLMVVLGPQDEYDGARTDSRVFSVRKFPRLKSLTLEEAGLSGLSGVPVEVKVTERAYGTRGAIDSSAAIPYAEKVASADQQVPGELVTREVPVAKPAEDLGQGGGTCGGSHGDETGQTLWGDEATPTLCGDETTQTLCGDETTQTLCGDKTTQTLCGDETAQNPPPLAVCTDAKGEEQKTMLSVELEEAEDLRRSATIQAISADEQRFESLFKVLEGFAWDSQICDMLWSFIQEIPTNSQLSSGISSGFTEHELEDHLNFHVYGIWHVVYITQIIEQELTTGSTTQPRSRFEIPLLNLINRVRGEPTKTKRQHLHTYLVPLLFRVWNLIIDSFDCTTLHQLGKEPGSPVEEDNAQSLEVPGMSGFCGAVQQLLLEALGNLEAFPKCQKFCFEKVPSSSVDETFPNSPLDEMVSLYSRDEAKFIVCSSCIRKRRLARGIVDGVGCLEMLLCSSSEMAEKMVTDEIQLTKHQREPPKHVSSNMLWSLLVTCKAKAVRKRTKAMLLQLVSKIPDFNLLDLMYSFQSQIESMRSLKTCREFYDTFIALVKRYGSDGSCTFDLSSLVQRLMRYSLQITSTPAGQQKQAIAFTRRSVNGPKQPQESMSHESTKETSKTRSDIAAGETALFVNAMRLLAVALVKSNTGVGSSEAKLQEASEVLPQAARSNQLAQHGNQLAQHGNQLAQHGNQLAQHGNQLAQHGNQLAQHGNQLAEQTAYINQIAQHTKQEGDHAPTVQPSLFMSKLWHDFLMDVEHSRPLCETDLSRQAVCDVLRALVQSGYVKPTALLHHMSTFIRASPVPMRSAGRTSTQSWDFDPRPRGPVTSIYQGRTDTGKVGLLNQGSTCYLNAVLQQLFHAQLFRDALLRAPIKPQGAAEGGESEPAEVVQVEWLCWCSGHNALQAAACHLCGTPKRPDAEVLTKAVRADAAATPAHGSTFRRQQEVLRQFQRTFLFLRKGEQGCLDPDPLVRACEVLNLEFSVTSQNDASEFYDKALDALEAALRGSPSALSALSRSFAGRQVKLKRCQVCGAESVSREESFNRLELVVKDHSIEHRDLLACLAALTRPEEMTGDNKVECDHCRTRTPTTFVTCLTQLPPCLVVHPKRFAFNLETMQTEKLNHRITFPRRLDMFPYTRAGMASARWSQTIPDRGTCREECAFELAGVVVHRGRAGGGHYYSFVRTDSGGREEWTRFDDDKVSAFDPDSPSAGLDAECFGGEYEREASYSWGGAKMETVSKEWNAFMLVYRRCAGASGPSGRSLRSALSAEEHSLKRTAPRGTSLLPATAPDRAANKVGRTNARSRSVTWAAEPGTEEEPAGRELRDLERRLAEIAEEEQPEGGRPSLQESALGRSLQEGTLGKLIVSHREWQTEMFRKSLDAQILLMNNAVRRQRLLFDSFFENLAFDMVKATMDAGTQFDPFQDAFTIVCGVALRSATKTQKRVDDWLARILSAFKAMPLALRLNAAQSFLLHVSAAPPLEACFGSSEPVRKAYQVLQQSNAALPHLGPLQGGTEHVRAFALDYRDPVARAAWSRLVGAALGAVLKAGVPEAQLEPVVGPLAAAFTAAVVHSFSPDAGHDQLEAVLATLVQFSKFPLFPGYLRRAGLIAPLVHLLMGPRSPAEQLSSGTFPVFLSESTWPVQLLGENSQTLPKLLLLLIERGEDPDGLLSELQQHAQTSHAMVLHPTFLECLEHRCALRGGLPAVKEFNEAKSPLYRVAEFLELCALKPTLPPSAFTAPAQPIKGPVRPSTVAGTSAFEVPPQRPSSPVQGVIAQEGTSDFMETANHSQLMPSQLIRSETQGSNSSSLSTNAIAGDDELDDELAGVYWDE